VKPDRSEQRLTTLDVARTLLEARRRGQSVACVKALSGAEAGHHLLVFHDGRTQGTLGSSGLDEIARQLGAAALQNGRCVLHQLDNGLQLFCEPQLTQDRLVIVGAGHIAVPLAQIGSTLGFHVIVLDDREEFAREARFPPDARVQRMDFNDPFAGVPLDAHSFVVLVTRAHKYDFDCLRAVLTRAEMPRYIGMIGSRRRVRAAFHALLEGGIPAPRLARVHAPVGLDIGAETPAEIAVSIAAELIRERAGSGTYLPLGAGERVLERFFAAKEDDG
jgi:xanthine dehydrogenase accessory factor